MFFFRKVLSSLELFQASHEGEGAGPETDVLVILSVPKFWQRIASRLCHVVLPPRNGANPEDFFVDSKNEATNHSRKVQRNICESSVSIDARMKSHDFATSLNKNMSNRISVNNFAFMKDPELV